MAEAIELMPPGLTPPGLTPPGLTEARSRRPKPPRHLADLEPAERRAVVAELGQPGFRADQLSRHYFARLTDDPADMTDLPAEIRDSLAGALLPPLLIAQRELQCDGGTTRKTLWRAFDGALVESVLMRYPDRVTMCVSSQAGCGMACPFCATGQAGLTRNLSAAEIVTQVFAGARAMATGAVPGGTGRVSNIVFMGMGEPLANYSSVLTAVRRHHGAAARRPRHLPARGNGLDGRARARRSRGWPQRDCRSGSRCRCMRRMTSFGTSSSPSTGAGR